MNRIDRRSLLRLSAAGACLHGMGLSALARPSRAAAGERKLLNIFLRGGNDGINTLIPQHDADYADPSVRPTLRVHPGQSLDLGAGGAHLHPALAPLLSIYNAGELALVHRVGFEGQIGSHFASQRDWETALPGDPDFDEGFVARWATHRLPDVELAAVSVSSDVQRMFSGPIVMPHVPTLGGFGPDQDPVVAKLLGTAPAGLEPGEGLIGSYHSGKKPGKNKGTYDAQVRKTGLALADTLSLIDTLPPYTPPAASFPTNLAELKALGLPAKPWAIDFFKALRDAVHLLLASDCRIAGIELTEFDHHTFQGTLQGAHAERLAVLAHGLRSIRHETLGGIWSDLAVVVESEFGRASRENASGGTDHGRAGLMLVAGGRVLGGVRNCDPVTWPSGQTLFSQDQKYVGHLTDFRAVLAEVFAKHFGASTTDLDVLIPGWSSFTGPEFDPLGILV